MDAADKVYKVIDNSNTPYGKSAIAHGYKKGLGDDPQDRAAKDIIGQIQRAIPKKSPSMNYFHEDDGK